MENKKINLNKIKVAIFDFDDTLAIHKDRDFIKHRNENEENLLNYFLNAYLYPDTFYDSIEQCELNEILFVDDKRENIKSFNNMGVHGLLPEDAHKLIYEE